MDVETVQAIKAHVAIHVRDVAASIDFYKKLFGIEPSKVRTGYAKFDVMNPPLNFTLNEDAGAAPGALSHLGIQVRSTADVLAVRRSWPISSSRRWSRRPSMVAWATSSATGTSVSRASSASRH